MRGYLEPCARQVPEWLGHDHAVLVGEPLESRVVGVKLAQGTDVLRDEQAARAVLA